MLDKTRTEAADSESRRGKRILVIAAVISVLVVLGIASAVYWRLHHEGKLTSHYRIDLIDFAPLGLGKTLPA
jgi:hypothetical protein